MFTVQINESPDTSRSVHFNAASEYQVYELSMDYANWISSIAHDFDIYLGVPKMVETAIKTLAIDDATAFEDSF